MTTAPPRPLTIWCNYAFPEPVMSSLLASVGPHKLLLTPDLQKSNLVGGGRDPQLAEADIALGQPDPQQIIDSPNVRWVHLTSAGYTRYDTPVLREALRGRGSALTTSSWVYEEPCAEHILSFMLALARQLPPMLIEQQTDR